MSKRIGGKEVGHCEYPQKGELTLLIACFCSLSFALRIRWLDKNPALKEFDKKHAFFQGLMTSIGKESRHRATWKKVFLSMGSAAFSLFDIGSDIFSMLVYRSRGLDDVAEMMIVFVLLSLGLQLIVVVAIHHKNQRRMLVEIVGTLTFTKAGFNKYRVLTDAKTDGHEAVPPVTEMVVFKLAEMFAESIPMVSAVLSEIARTQYLLTRSCFADGAAGVHNADE